MDETQDDSVDRLVDVLGKTAPAGPSPASAAVAATRPARQKRASGALVAGVVIVILGAGVLGWLLVRAIPQKPKPTPVGDIRANIRKWDEQPVFVAGQASNSMNLLGLKYFTLTDATGEIIVVTEEGLPADGDQVSVNGIVKQLFKVGSMEETVIYESTSGGEKSGDDKDTGQ